MRRLSLLVLVSVMAAGTTGCQVGHLQEEYEPAPPMVREARTDLLLVTRPTENRPLMGRTSMARGLFAFIPLVPYGTQKYTPEVMYRAGAFYSTYSFYDDLGETIAEDLRASGLTRDAFYTADIPQPRGTLIANARENSSSERYRLDIELQKGIWNRNLTLYGLSLPGLALFFVGAPTAYGNVELQIEVTLVNPDDLPIATETFYGTAPVTTFLLGDPNKAMRRLPWAYGQISTELRQFLDENIP